MKIALENVSVRFGDVTALSGITLALAERRIGIIGDNGSGKSTFARLLNGLVLPSEGHVLVDGIDTRQDASAVRRQVGFAFQNPESQIVMPTVEEDVALGLKARKVPAPDLAVRVEAALERCNITHLRSRSSFLLSGGEKQLVALAGVLVLDPALVVFDEPTTMLDRRNAQNIMAAIKGLPEQVIVVTHHVELLEGFDRVIVLHQGRVAADAAPADAIRRYEALLP